MTDIQSRSGSILDFDWQMGRQYQGYGLTDVKNIGLNSHIEVAGGPLTVHSSIEGGSVVVNTESTLTQVKGGIGIGVKLRTSGDLEIADDVGSYSQLQVEGSFSADNIRDHTTIHCNGDNFTVKGAIGRNCTIIHTGNGLLRIDADIGEDTVVESQGHVEVGGKTITIEKAPITLGTVRDGASITGKKGIYVAKSIGANVCLKSTRVPVDGNSPDAPQIYIRGAECLQPNGEKEWVSTGENSTISSTGSVKLCNRLGANSLVDAGSYIDAYDIDEHCVLTSPHIQVNGKAAESTQFNSDDVVIKKAGPTKPSSKVARLVEERARAEDAATFLGLS